MIHIGSLPASWPSVVAVDLETQGLDPHQHAILSVTIFDGTDTWVVFPAHTCYQEIGTMLADETVEKVFHNAGFDIGMLLQNGFDVLNVFDTFLAESVLCGGNKMPLSLDEVLSRHCGVYIAKDTRMFFIDHPPYPPHQETSELAGIRAKAELETERIKQKETALKQGYVAEYLEKTPRHAGKTLDQLPKTVQERVAKLKYKPATEESFYAELLYMVGDVVHLLKLRETQIIQLKRAGLLPTLQIEFDVTRPITETELAGMCLDVPMWLSYIQIFDEKIEACDRHLRELLGPEFVLEVPGVKDGCPVLNTYDCEDINFGSTQQLTAVFSRLGIDTGGSTAKDVLESFLDRKIPDKARQFITTLLELKVWNKKRTYKYETFINPVTGRIHPSFKQNGAGTGRMSCSEPNTQQVPRPVPGEPNMRIIWIPDTPDYVIMSADYSQQEPRVLAHLCQDPAMIIACSSTDVYSAAGEIVYGKPLEKGSPERMTMKILFLATLYGAQPDTLQASSGLTFDDCVHIHTAIKTAFPIAAAFGTKMTHMIKNYGFTTTAIGRRRYFNQRDHVGPQAVNTPTQGTAADMMKVAIAKIYRALTELKLCAMIDPNTRLWNYVHDENVLCVHRGDVPVVSPLVKILMEEAGAAMCPSVKHIAEISIHDRWDK